MKPSQLRSHNISQPANELTIDKYNIKKLCIKDTVCICSACFITREFLDSYYSNNALIRDTDKLVHIPKVQN